MWPEHLRQQQLSFSNGNTKQAIHDNDDDNRYDTENTDQLSLASHPSTPLLFNLIRAINGNTRRGNFGNRLNLLRIDPAAYRR